MKVEKLNTDYDSLRSIYEEVLGNKDKDPIEHILVLTYEFDDQQLLNLISNRTLEEDFELRQNDLKFISDLRPVVFYDARKTREFNQLPHFLELFPIRTKAYSCHHSKAYLIVTQHAVRLILGSMNLTRTGLFANREVFQDFFWDKEHMSDLPVLASFVELIRKGYGPDLSESVAVILARLDNQIKGWGQDKNEHKYSLLASGYPHTAAGVAQLKEIWQKTSDIPPSNILAISPFFDKAGGGILFSDKLCSQLGAEPELVLVTDMANKETLSKKHFGTRALKKTLYMIPSEVSAEERKRIQEFNNNISTKDLVIERKLHAKILVLMAKDKSLVYMGSANFTNKAWNGDNHELGLVWWEKGDPKKIQERILNCLQASKEDTYEKLQEQPPPDLNLEDDEDYQEDSAYPDFIRSVVLNLLPSNEKVQFEFHGEKLEKLSEYSVLWSKLPLIISGNCSQELTISEFYSRLMGGKNLVFKPKTSPEKLFYIPFHHNPKLFQQRDLYLFQNSEDWLRFYLGNNRETANPQGEYIPGEDGDPAVEADIGYGVDRDSNVVIHIQHYLSLFSKIEKEFVERSNNIKNLLDDDRKDSLHKYLIGPLKTYAHILQREKGTGNKKMAYNFKMGELIIFCKHLAEIVPELRDLVSEFSDTIRAAEVNANSVLNEYMIFCTKEA